MIFNLVTRIYKFFQIYKIENDQLKNAQLKIKN